MKLDRLVARHERMGRLAARQMIAGGRVRVDGVIVRDRHAEIDRFRAVVLDESEDVQRSAGALYLVLNKPAGWLSATRDARHPTVLDLIDHPEKDTLHLAGRLDRYSSGLLLLTNDGRWSKRLMAAESKVPKVYLVETEQAIPSHAVEAFARGFFFHTEGIHTLPAILEIEEARRAKVTLSEGRYHQVKRLFHRVGCRVTALHRESVGRLRLPPELVPGAWRALTAEEVDRAATAANPP